MASIKTQVSIVDKMTAPLMSIVGSLDTVITALEEVDQATEKGFDTSAVLAARQALDMANMKVVELTQNLDKSTAEQEKLNSKVQQGKLAMGGLAGKAMGLVAAYGGLQGGKALLALSDNMATVTARLKMVNDGHQELNELQKMIFDSAQRSKAGFLETADVVSKLSQKTKGVFSSNAETITFAENLNKSFIVAGTSQQEMAAASLQLTQALGSGVLRGDELNSIFEAAPNLIQTIAEYMQVPIGEIRELAGEGKITASIVKNALLESTDQINEQFGNMPMTWGQVWAGIVNRLIYASQPLLQFLNYLAKHWESIEPIVIGVAGAIGIYTTALIAYNTVQAISNGLQAISTAQSALKAGATLAEAAATTTATGAQAGLNAAILACPITWIILAILAVVAVIIKFISWLYQAEGTTTSITGAIAGAFSVLGANIYNWFIAPVWNQFAAFANFFGNVWKDPVAAVKVLFFDLAQTAIRQVMDMASAIEKVINKIPGLQVDITSGLSGFYNKIEEASKKVKDESGWIEYVSKIDLIDYQDAYDAGQKFGQGIDQKISNIFGGDIGGAEFNFSPDMLDTISNIGDNTKDIKNSVSATAEELKFLRDLAETEAINRYTTAEIKVEMGGVVNHVSKETDLDGVMAYLEETLEETMAVVAEGVHE